MEPYRTLTDGTQIFIQPPPPRDPYADFRETEWWRAYAVFPDGSRKDLPDRSGWAGAWHTAGEARMWADAWADAREKANV